MIYSKKDSFLECNDGIVFTLHDLLGKEASQRLTSSHAFLSFQLSLKSKCYCTYWSNVFIWCWLGNVQKIHREPKMQISAAKLTLWTSGINVRRVKVQFHLNFAARAIEFCSSAADAVLRCLYSQRLHVVSLCQGSDWQSL